MYIKSNKYDYHCTNLGITKTLVLKYVNIPALTTGYNNLETDTEEGVPERARLFSHSGYPVISCLFLSPFQLTLYKYHRISLVKTKRKQNIHHPW